MHFSIPLTPNAREVFHTTLDSWRAAVADPVQEAHRADFPISRRANFSKAPSQKFRCVKRDPLPRLDRWNRHVQSQLRLEIRS
jgi:hypothetical protein